MNGSMFSTLWYKVFRSGNPLFLCIGVNTLVFLALNMVRLLSVFGLGSNQLLPWALTLLHLPADPMVLLWHPWTFITYMFTQVELFHFVFNMLWLYWLGIIFLDFLSKKQLIFTYLAGGMAGAILFLGAYNFLPFFSESGARHVLIGSSAAVSAIVFATATLVPDYSIRMLFFGNVKLKYLALAFVLLNILGIAGSNAGGNIAHLGGALLGFVYVRQLQAGNDWSKVLNGFSLRRRAKLRVSARSEFSHTESPRSRKRYVDERTDQEMVDRILDKISYSGYDSLSQEEKEALFRLSKEDETKQ